MRHAFRLPALYGGSAPLGTRWWKPHIAIRTLTVAWQRWRKPSAPGGKSQYGNFRPGGNNSSPSRPKEPGMRPGGNGNHNNNNNHHQGVKPPAHNGNHNNQGVKPGNGHNAPTNAPGIGESRTITVLRPHASTTGQQLASVGRQQPPSSRTGYASTTSPGQCTSPDPSGPWNAAGPLGSAPDASPSPGRYAHGIVRTSRRMASTSVGSGIVRQFSA